MRNRLFLLQFSDEECTYLVSAKDEYLVKMKFIKFCHKQDGWMDIMQKEADSQFVTIQDLIHINEIPIPKFNEVIQSGLADHFYG
jgi:hypothetical protein